jgi:hypothetical protein
LGFSRDAMPSFFLITDFTESTDVDPAFSALSARFAVSANASGRIDITRPLKRDLSGGPRPSFAVDDADGAR